MARVKRPWLLTGLAIVLLLESCSGSPDNGSPSQALHRGNGGTPQTLDPALAEDVHAFNVLADLYEGLVVENSVGQLSPGVAQRWTISDDGLVYTFFLRNDAHWSNTDAVTAHDFVAALRRNVRQSSAYSFLLSPIKNFEAVARGDLPPSALGVAVAGDFELSIQLATPAPYFLGILAMPISFPLYSAGTFNPQRFDDPRLFVGNGPYVLEENRLMGRIRLRRNPEYHAAASVNIEFVDYFPVSDPNSELNMYRAGELDITATVPPAMLDTLQETRPDELQVAPSLALYYLAFDLSEPPLNEVKLRIALSKAIDRRALVELLGRGEQAAFGVVPPGVSGHDLSRYPWALDSSKSREAAARQAYADAGYDTNNPLKITLTYDVGDIHETVALAVGAMWGEVLGVQVSLDKREWKYFLATRQKRQEWQIMRFSWFGDYNDATTFLDIFRADSPQNLSGYANDLYDSLLDDAATVADTRERSHMMTAAENRLLADYPIAPLYFYVSKHMVSSRVKGFEPNVLDRHPSRYLTLGESASDLQ